MLRSLLHFQLEVPVLENRTRLGRQQGTLWWLVLRFPVVADGLHGDPLDAFELVDVLDVSVPEPNVSFSCFVFPLRKEAGYNLPLEHHQAMRMAAHIRVHRHRVHESLVVLAVEELEAVHPHLLDVAWVHPTMTIGRCIKLVSKCLDNTPKARTQR